MSFIRNVAAIVFLTLVAGFLAFLAIGSGCVGHGTQVDFTGGRIYYTGEATKTDAEKLGQYMVREKLFRVDSPKDLQLDLANRRYVVRFIAKLGVENNSEMDDAFRRMGGELSHQVFDGAPVDIALCDDGFKPLRTIAFTPLKPPLPLRLTFRKSIGGGGWVAQFHNDSAKILTVKVSVGNPTLGAGKDLVFDLVPGRVFEHGWLEGWNFTSGETLRVVHADYEPASFVVP